MQEVSGTEKGFLANAEKAVVKGATEAAKVATKVVKNDQENYRKQKQHPKDWHKWLPGNNGLYDETPSGEQDAMQEVVGNGKHYPRDWHKWLPGNNGLYDENSSGEQDAMQEVVGNGKHYPKDWHKWLPGNNGLYDENPSDEQ